MRERDERMRVCQGQFGLREGKNADNVIQSGHTDTMATKTIWTVYFHYYQLVRNSVVCA